MQAQRFTPKHLFRIAFFAVVTTLMLMSYGVGHANSNEGEDKHFGAVLSVGFPVNTRIDGDYAFSRPKKD